jgi:signal peptidase II
VRELQAARGTSLSERAETAAGSAAADDDETTRRLAVRSIGLLAVVAAVVLGADLASKTIVVATLTGRPPLRLLGGLVYLVHTRNSGAAFSLGTGQTILLSLVAAAVVVAIVRYARRLRSRPWAVCLGLILGGALGNLVDRVFRAPGVLRGAVVDWISLLAPDGHVWPVFNVADSCLVIGVLLAVTLELTGRRIDGRRGGGSGRG